MEADRLDALAARVSQALTRRRVGVAGAALAGGLLLPGEADAKRRKKRPCPPCFGRKQGKCRKQLPDGTPCATGVCKGGQCTCVPATCASLGVTCGPAPDGCGGTLSCGGCGTGATPACNNGTCAVCTAVCPNTCVYCFGLPDGSSVCGDGGGSDCLTGCARSADCPAANPFCVSTITDRTTGITRDYRTICGKSTPGFCYAITPC